MKRATELGLQAIAAPLFEIESIDWEPPDPSSFDGLLLTSANAVRQAGDKLIQLRGLKAYAVGETTAEAARDAGLDIAATGDSGVDRLLGSIGQDLALLHLCGEHRRGSPDAKQRITPIPVYRAKALEKPDLSTASKSVVIVHSPRAGQRLGELIPDRASISIAAISSAAADAAGSGWAAVEIASEPSDEALLALAARLCNNSQPE